MPLIKKLDFALPFLLALFGTYQYLSTFLQNPYLIFDFNVATLVPLALFLLLLLLSGLFFVVFSTLAQDLKITLPATFLGAFSALLIIPAPLSLVVAFGSLIVLTLTLLTLNKKLATYLTFQPAALLVPAIRQLAPLLLLVFSITFYLAADAKVKTEGFEVPDSILDPVINMTMSQLPNPTSPTSPTTPKNNSPQIPPEQIEMLRQNPALLQQYGLDPSVLDELSPQTPKTSQNPQQALIKTEVKKQLQSVIAPQINLIPPILAALFFFTLQFGLTLFSIILSPLIWLIFWILGKTGFTTYTKEMREVKKLVV